MSKEEALGVQMGRGANSPLNLKSVLSFFSGFLVSLSVFMGTFGRFFTPLPIKNLKKWPLPGKGSVDSYGIGFRAIFYCSFLLAAKIRNYFFHLP